MMFISSAVLLPISKLMVPAAVGEKLKGNWNQSMSVRVGLAPPVVAPSTDSPKNWVDPSIQRALRKSFWSVSARGVMGCGAFDGGVAMISSQVTGGFALGFF